MTQQEIDIALIDLKSELGEVAVRNEPDGDVLIKIARVALPPRCMPSHTPVLVAIKPNDPIPKVYVSQGIRLANGVEPRSTSPVQIGGEPWLQFSYNVPSPSGQPISKMVLTRLQRFAKDD